VVGVFGIVDFGSVLASGELDFAVFGRAALAIARMLVDWAGADGGADFE
jgi:hypothetical protein